MRTALLLIALLATPAFAAQTVWKWVDANGVTHYSDRPVPGATRMEINVSSRADAPSRSTFTNDADASRQDEANAEPYSMFEIWRPDQEESVVNTGGRVSVSIRIDPALRPGHDLHLYLDGRLVEGESPTATSYELTEVPRGEHQVVAVITDQRGQRVQETRPVRFFVRQTSIAQPPVGPALRTAPKPRPRAGANKLPSEQPSYAALNGAPLQVDPATNLPRKEPAQRAPAKAEPSPASKQGG
ncbi:MAG TPA: DUF4124 domain-containing protein [Steroidobacter sp.]|nr:DUF4124 domain-containing protein [Steroidobacteraceae bacterium]HLS82262.1 DUF4124 domain-containing protein [Steroidobacter sp.]